MTKHKDLFTNRQLNALTTLSNLVDEVQRVVEIDAVKAGFADDHIPYLKMEWEQRRIAKLLVYIFLFLLTK